MKMFILTVALAFGFALIGQPAYATTDIDTPAYKLVGISYEV